MQHLDLTKLAGDGQRLIAAYAAVIRSLPEKAQGIGPMARYLEIHKGTCQRVVEGAMQSRDGLHAFARFPGITALRVYLEACRAKGVPGELLSGAESATGAFEDVLRKYDVSQRGLLDAIASSGGSAVSAVGQDRSRVERRSLFASARRVTGEHVEAKVSVGISFPSPAREGHARVVAIVAYRGVRREPYARPIVAFMLDRQHTNGAGNHHWSEFLPELSTPGVLPLARPGPHGTQLMVIDTDRAPEPDGGVDAAVMFVTDEPVDPRLQPGVVLTAGVRVMQPTKTLVHDTYIHRDIDPGRAPRVGCFTLMAPPGDTPEGGYEACAHERFPEDPQVGPLTAAEDGHERLAAELAAFAMKAHKLDPTSMRGWRTRVDYPLWQTEYRTYI